MILSFIGMPGGWEIAVIAIIGLLLFGRRLPSVGKYLGESIVGFKKGIQGMADIDVGNNIDILPPSSKKK